MKRFAVIPFAILLLLSGCLPPNLPVSPTPAPTAISLAATPFPTSAVAETLPGPTYTAIPAAETPSGDITPELLKNFAYWVAEFNTLADLQNGTFRNNTIDSMLVEPVALGDLNGDGRQDAAVILAVNSGGSGTFFYLFAVVDQNGTPQQAALSFIGDRQGIRSLQIVDGQIILDYLTQGPNDALCCPGQHRLRSYQLESGRLGLVSEQILDN